MIYGGPCIGGPKKGELIAHHSKTMVVEELEPDGNLATAQIITRRTHVYRYSDKTKAWIYQNETIYRDDIR